MDENKIEDLMEQIGVQSIEEAMEIIVEYVKTYSSKRKDKISNIEIACELVSEKIREWSYLEEYEKYQEAFQRIMSKVLYERPISTMTEQEIIEREEELDLLGTIDIRKIIS